MAKVNRWFTLFLRGDLRYIAAGAVDGGIPLPAVEFRQS